MSGNQPISPAILGGSAEEQVVRVRGPVGLCRFFVTNRAHFDTCTESRDGPAEG